MAGKGERERKGRAKGKWNNTDRNSVPFFFPLPARFKVTKTIKTRYCIIVLLCNYFFQHAAMLRAVLVIAFLPVRLSVRYMPVLCQN